VSSKEDSAKEAGSSAGAVARRSDAWTDLALVVPIFVGYHLGVVLLNVRNAADPVTGELTKLAERNVGLYWVITLGIGVGLVAVLSLLGRGQAFDKKRFLLVAAEAVAYAVLMRSAGIYAVGSLPLGGAGLDGPAAGVIMSLGAGFYEEVTFRVGLFGLGALAIGAFLGGLPRWLFTAVWAIAAAAVFAGWHYFGALGDAWDLRTFVFRATCGLVLTAIYVFRGFAPAVWTHALYDIWVLAL
jgi:hypothetical protein